MTTSTTRKRRKRTSDASGSAANRLFSANRAELERALKRADGSADGDAYAALIARLGDWMSGQRGRERSAAMARNELTLVRNEALIAGYRTMGFQSVWVAESGCCQACRRLNGQTVTTLKPPLHNGCMCSIRKGEKMEKDPLKSQPEDDRIKADEDTSGWYREHIAGKPEMELKYKRALEVAQREAEFGGFLAKPVLPKGLENFRYDSAHANGERHHNVTEEEARSFIQNAIVVAERKRGQQQDFFSIDGGGYTLVNQKKIRTAFKKEEFYPDVKKMMEVLMRELEIS